MATSRATITVVETTGFEDAPFGDHHHLPGADYETTRTALLSAEFVRTDGESQAVVVQEIIREGNNDCKVFREGKHYCLPGANYYQTVKKLQDAGFVAVVSILELLDAQENRDGGSQ